MASETLRDRFTKLCIYDGVSFPKGLTDGRPVFYPDELSREPLKWLKYLLLDRVGLESIVKISSQINRFNLQDIESAKRWVHERFCSTSTPGLKRIIVAKVVPWNRAAQLKNYVMLGIEQIEPSFKEILGDFPNCQHELWCCESSIGEVGFNIGGRLDFHRRTQDQILELVWFATPRTIESVQLPSFAYPYIRAIGEVQKPKFEIELFHVPESYGKYRARELWMQDYVWVARELGSRRRSIDLLVSTLYEFGAREVCFCFKVSDGRLTIIDWDTEIESTAK
jgi:hypothetical protein